MPHTLPGVKAMTAEMRAYVNKTLARFPEATCIFKRGGTCNVYLLPSQKKVLRITGIGQRTWSYVQKLETSFKAAFERANRSGVTPRTNLVDMMMRRQDPNSENLLITTMDFVDDIVDFPKWAELFDNDEMAIVTALFKAAEKLEGAGVLHTDINSGNVVITKDGKVLFIDLDGACPTDMGALTCSHLMGSTTPFVLPPRKRERYGMSEDFILQNMHAGLLTLAALAVTGDKKSIKSPAQAAGLFKTPALKRLVALVCADDGTAPRTARDILNYLRDAGADVVADKRLSVHHRPPKPLDRDLPPTLPVAVEDDDDDDRPVVQQRRRPNGRRPPNRRVEVAAVPPTVPVSHDEFFTPPASLEPAHVSSKKPQRRNTRVAADKKLVPCLVNQVRNPLTRRCVAIGTKTYRKLVKEGVIAGKG